MLTVDINSEEWPPAVAERLDEIDFDAVVDVAQRSLDEFSWAIDGQPSGIEVLGVVIVGSALSDEFDEYESDLDIYVLANSAYEHEDGFCQMMLDGQSAYREQMHYATPDYYTTVDVLGITTPALLEKDIREPSFVAQLYEHVESR